MPKNKFIKILKIIAVIGPLVFNFIGCLIASLSVGNMFAMNPDLSGNPISTTYVPQIENFIVCLNEQCFYDYGLIVLGNQNSSVPILYETCNFMVEITIGVELQDIISLGNSTLNGYLTMLFLICYYLYIEFLFFIPEVLIIFIRWSKNLMYKFMDKSGGDF